MSSLDIQFHELPHSKPIRQFIKKSLSKLFQEPSTSVRIEFFRAQVEPMVECQVEVKRGGQSWRYSEFGKGIHQTFLKCLKHVMAKTVS